MIYFKCNNPHTALYSQELSSNIQIDSDEWKSLINYLTAANARYLEGFINYSHLLHEDFGVRIPVTTAQLIKDFCQLVEWEWRESNG